MQKIKTIEWPTVALFCLAYAIWVWAVFWLANGALVLGIVVAAVAIAFHGSLQHEAIHGHPTRWTFANTFLAWPPLTVVIPYLRFRDTHLDHHQDATLTDPYEDPETNFMDPGDFQRLWAPFRWLRRMNNTLAGRLVLGPVIGTVCFFLSEIKRHRADPRITRGWLWHLPAVTAVLLVVWMSPMPIWAYAIAVYAALALLRIRTFLEHQAHHHSRARSVIIEDTGPLAFLFLNNNLHAVHHAHPKVAWYKLPGLFRRHRDRFLAMNGGYRYRSYGQVFRAHAFAAKDPVPHPLRSPEP